ncbi:unnamed protein product [Cyclocybe aegerita]|uniref:SP-RING-type domain-containing protein n=1 Tax=Cyclocybe aegerita TaxID=1973307 RepID=A0A8S0XNR9_CYCAE|nr:unnamed protein product [Cyclocybe aegerita]
MPVATSSRRKPTLRRQNSEEIEDARPTQAPASDEDQPRRNGRVKKEKQGKGKQRAETDDEETARPAAAAADDDDEDDDDRIDVANFPNQPFGKLEAVKLKGISEDWDNMRNLIGQHWEIYRDVASAMAETGERDLESSESLRELDRDMKEFIDVGAEMGAHSQALNDMHQQIIRGEVVADAQARYEEGLKAILDQYAGKTTRQKYARDERYQQFHASIWEVHHPEQPMPPLTEFIDKETGDDSDEDDDLEIGGVTQNFTCPLSLTPLLNPLTSKVCKHSFSADAIKDYCRDPRKAYKCPAAGCNKSFKLSDCIADTALAKKVKAQRRRIEAAAADSDAEEVVD